MLSHIGVDNFLGGGLVFSWPQGGKGTCRRRNGERERGRGLWGGNGIQQVQTGAGGGSSDRVGHPRPDEGSGERTEEGEEAGSQLARRPPGLLTSLYKVSTSSSDVFCFIPLSQSGLLPLCLPDWKQISVQTQSTYLITQSSSHYWTSLWHPNNGTPPSFSSAVVQRARVSTSFLAKTLDWIFGLDSFQSSIVLSYSFFSVLENKYLYQTRVLLLLGFFFTEA